MNHECNTFFATQLLILMYFMVERKCLVHTTSQFIHRVRVGQTILLTKENLHHFQRAKRSCNHSVHRACASMARVVGDHHARSLRNKSCTAPLPALAAIQGTLQVREVDPK